MANEADIIPAPTSTAYGAQLRRALEQVAEVWSKTGMPQRSVPQLSLSFVRAAKKKGGLVLDDYRALVERLRTDAARVAKQFNLPAYELDADRPDAHDRYGVCFQDGRIRVRLIHARTGRPLRYSALIDTVIHELAHLRHMNHGPHWEALYEKMLAWARQQGIYTPQLRRTVPPLEPTEMAPQQPAQLGLFARQRKSDSL